MQERTSFIFVFVSKEPAGFSEWRRELRTKNQKSRTFFEPAKTL